MQVKSASKRVHFLRGKICTYITALPLRVKYMYKSSFRGSKRHHAALQVPFFGIKQFLHCSVISTNVVPIFIRNLNGSAFYAACRFHFTDNLPELRNGTCEKSYDLNGHKTGIQAARVVAWLPGSKLVDKLVLDRVLW